MPDFTDALRPSHPNGSTTLTSERAQSDVNVHHLSQHLFSTDGFLQRQTRILALLQNEVLSSKATQQHLFTRGKVQACAGAGKTASSHGRSASVER
ncbi:hypothetical protein N7539_001644 [Penicillium diatomitis]|uniref:Uncharacterized protein n=1 Tax=Penicillium diatomitis TaxID=2819901 RepID=A0A9W9XHC7_9EURO|nr:uncharacterized protein N7539_001644 [Penicillium diatomitis]KAJ5492898.1 hypothetical protein N7539_001644 [Penicillium diatomitis]